VPVHPLIVDHPAQYDPPADADQASHHIDPVADLRNRLQVDDRGRTDGAVAKGNQQIGASGERHRIVTTEQLASFAERARGVVLERCGHPVVQIRDIVSTITP
jgi:hypothetical protein